MFYILHGEDEFTRSEVLADMKKRMGDPTTLALNTSVFEGDEVALAELIQACDTVPFLGERRLIIVKGLLTRLESTDEKELEEEIKEYLKRLPETTRLIFLEDKSLSRGNTFLKLAKSDGRGYVREFPQLSEGNLDRWIEGRVRAKGGLIEPSATKELVDFVGNNLRLLDQELDKLLTYADGARPITLEDVHLLVSYVREKKVFQMVDSLGKREVGEALNLLQELLEAGEHPARLLSMIVRQFRIMMEAKELSQGGASPAELRARLKLPQFVIEKVLKQAAPFSPEQLDDIHRELLETDLAIKTSQIEPSLALEMLIIKLGRRE